jgi:iron-sulfur cluster assembly accessory protein
MIRVTDSAADQLRELLKERAEEGEGLRLMVEKGGCAGLSYVMKIDRALPGDEVVKKGGVAIIVDALSGPYLRDCTVDYVHALNDSGFKIQNPNAARSCGCGTSFEPSAAGPVEAAPSVPDGESCSGSSS